MTKSKLKNGALVKTKGGLWCVLLGNTKMNGTYCNVLLVLARNTWLDLDDYNVSLEHPNDSQYDIVTIADYSSITDVLGAKVDIKDIYGFKVIWERKDPKVAEVESLIAKLQGQLAAAQEELGRLQ